jgi:serine/threonine protein kinase
MESESWQQIEQLFFRGLHASETVRREILADIADRQVAAAVTQLWAYAARAPSGFLHDGDAPPIGPYKIQDIVENRFKLETLLGAGGMGQVFGAVDTRLDRPVALKFLNPRLVRHPTMRGLIEREARAVCRLAGHPNVCTVHDLYWDGDTPFLVMELLPGETLASRLTRGALAVQDAVAIGLSIVEGLAHAHAKDVIHRDLKPGNVMLTPFGPKLFDFGIAKLIGPTVPNEHSVLAPPGTFVGSASYTSPEQAEGTPIDARSDIFSMGCVLYEMVTAVKAFDGASRLSTLSAVLRAEPREIRDINPSVPLEYAQIVARCLRKEPSRRFQNTTDLRDAMDRLARSGFDTHGTADDAAFTRVDPPESGDGEISVLNAPEESATADDKARPTHQAHRSGLSATAEPNRSAVGKDATGAATEAGAHASRLARRVLSRGNGHSIVLGVSVIYGLMVGLALLVEIAYEWPAFGSWALPIAALTCIATTAVSLTAFAVLRRRIVRAQQHALLVTLSVFVFWSVLLAVTIGPRLPDRPLVRARIQTMTANVGYPKSLLEALALPVLALVPIQIVCALEAELRGGRARNVYRILTSRHQRVSIPGTVVIRPNAAGIVFAIVTIWWMGQNARLLENLEIGPYHGLFLQLGFVRVASGLLMLLAVLVWYIWSFSDLRQEAQQLLGR